MRPERGIPVSALPRTRAAGAALLAALVLLALPEARGGEGRTVDCARDGFSITLPPDWVPIPKAALDEMTRNVGRLSPNMPKQTYAYGFQKDRGGEWLVYPYVLIQVNTNGKIDSRELRDLPRVRKTMQEGADQASESLKGLVGSLKMDTPSLDEENHILWTGGRTKVAMVGTLHMLSAFHLTEKGMIQVYGYGTDEEWKTHGPVVRNTLASVEVDESIRYRPPGLWSNPGLIGAVAGALVALVYAVARKKK